MSDAPALASATLAQLYIQQDHLEQARRVLARVLAADPLHGHALALQERLAARSRARLYAAYRPGRGLLVRWHDAPVLPDLHLIAAVFRPVAGGVPGATVVRVTSARCSEEAGEHCFAAGEGGRTVPGSAALSLARLAGGALEILAVHEPVSWP